MKPDWDKKNFFWGAATAAHQVEGDNFNDWSEWEEDTANLKVEQAKKKSWPDYILERYPNPTQKENYISGRACDEFNRYEEDFNIAKSLGHTAHRFSLEWSRIEPQKGKFDQEAIEHYRQVIRVLRERGLEPFVTLWHWTNPVWIAREGGWESHKTCEYFLRFAKKAIAEYGSEVRFWIPLNEPGTFIGGGYVQGYFPPQKRNLGAADRVFKNLMRAQCGAYRLIKKQNPDALVGVSHYAVYMDAYQNRWYNKLAVRLLGYVRSGRFLAAMKDSYDFIGVQYYHHDRIALAPGGRYGIFDVRNENNITSDLGWEICPNGLYRVLKDMDAYAKPIIITENGLADARDEKRSSFIRAHVSAMRRAMDEGVDVRGYFYWSLLDNFEWNKGFWPRFGLVEVDYHTLERRIRRSAWDFKSLIQEMRL